MFRGLSSGIAAQGDALTTFVAGSLTRLRLGARLVLELGNLRGCALRYGFNIAEPLQHPCNILGWSQTTQGDF